MFIDPPSTPQADAFWQREIASDGYISNWARAWAWRPDVAEAFAELRKRLMASSSLTPREFAVLVCATARTLGDSYCAIAWGTKLASLADPVMAGELLRGGDASRLSRREAALDGWARQAVQDPNGVAAEHVATLRSAGLSDKEIFEATAFVAFRLAFSAVNDALGAIPDRQVVDQAPPEVRSAVTWGRRPAA